MEGKPHATRPAWREPMVWLLVAIPALAVFASVMLLVAADRTSGNNDLVPDKVLRTGQAQVADLGPSQRASALGLGAVVRVSARGIDALPTTGGFDRSQPLMLSLAHPLEAAKDRTVELEPSALGWHAAGEVDQGHDLKVRQQPKDGAWRNDGGWQRGQQAVFVHPALPGDG
jgi:hypothetical protein